MIPDSGGPTTSTPSREELLRRQRERYRKEQEERRKALEQSEAERRRRHLEHHLRTTSGVAAPSPIEAAEESLKRDVAPTGPPPEFRQPPWRGRPISSRRNMRLGSERWVLGLQQD